MLEDLLVAIIRSHKSYLKPYLPHGSKVHYSSDRFSLPSIIIRFPSSYPQFIKRSSAARCDSNSTALRCGYTGYTRTLYFTVIPPSFHEGLFSMNLCIHRILTAAQKLIKSYHFFLLSAFVNIPVSILSSVQGQHPNHQQNNNYNHTEPRGGSHITHGPLNLVRIFFFFRHNKKIFSSFFFLITHFCQCRTN